MELWELFARESIRDTYARYNQSGDAFRLEELAACFVEDGALEVRGQEPYVGREAIVRNLGGGRGATTEEIRAAAKAEASTGGGTKRIMRHNVSNLQIQSLTQQDAHSVAYFLVVTETGVDHYGRYRDHLVEADGTWLFKHRFVSVDWHAATGPAW
jgi:hypothetical protein